MGRNPKLSAFLKKAAKQGKGRRIPEPKPIYLKSLDYASSQLGYVSGKVPADAVGAVDYVAERLRVAQEYYHTMAEKHAMRAPKRGKPRKNDPGVMFIYAMAHIWFDATGHWNFFRRNNELNEKQVNRFQKFCSGWMECVDPEYELTDEAYKRARKQVRKRHG